MTIQKEEGWKCVVCGGDANYILMGNSYCKEHKDKKQRQINDVLEKHDAAK